MLGHLRNALLLVPGGDKVGVPVSDRRLGLRLQCQRLVHHPSSTTPQNGPGGTVYSIAPVRGGGFQPRPTCSLSRVRERVGVRVGEPLMADPWCGALPSPCPSPQGRGNRDRRSSRSHLEGAP